MPSIRTTHSSGQDEILDYYHSVASHLLSASCTISHFLRAYSLVSSRAFMVDAYHGLSMVPIADAWVLPVSHLTRCLTRPLRFNHVTENHVHLEVGKTIRCYLRLLYS